MSIVHCVITLRKEFGPLQMRIKVAGLREEMIEFIDVMKERSKKGKKITVVQTMSKKVAFKSLMKHRKR